MFCRKETTVTCEVCKCEIKKQNAHMVWVVDAWYESLDKREYYCLRCHPGYDKRREIPFTDIKYYKFIPEHYEEVKIKEKK